MYLYKNINNDVCNEKDIKIIRDKRKFYFIIVIFFYSIVIVYYNRNYRKWISTFGKLSQAEEETKIFFLVFDHEVSWGGPQLWEVPLSPYHNPD